MMKHKLTLAVSAAMLMTMTAGAQNGLFISEIIDPADDYGGRFIELFNAGTDTVDFSTTTFYLSRQSNGGSTWGELQLEGTVPPGETFVVGGSGFADIYGFLPDQQTGILTGNGDDAYGLFRDNNHTAGTLHDIFGAIDVNGSGEPWEYTDKRGLRLEGVTAPNSVWTAAEWELVTAGVSDADPGIHHGMGGGDLPEPGVYEIIAGMDTVAAGGRASIPVQTAYLTTSGNVISWQFRLTYDSTLLVYASHALTGTLSENGTAVVNSDSAGILTVSFMQTEPLTGEGSLIDLQFDALLPGTSGILVTEAYINNIPVEELTPGAVVVTSGAPPVAAITCDDSVHRFADTLLITATFSASMDPAVPVTFSLEGAATLTDAVMTRVNDTVYNYAWFVPKAEGDAEVVMTGGSDMWGTEVLPAPASGATIPVMPFRPGDVDDDGRILAYDAALTLQHSVGLDPLPGTDPLPWEPWRDSTANVDGAPGITANDAALILQYSAGILMVFPPDSKKSAAAAGVTVERDNEYLLFRSYGDLIGLNISAEDAVNRLGEPEILARDFISAINLEEGHCRVGMAAPKPAPDGTVLMRIPVYGTGKLILRMLVNRQEQEMEIDLATGLRGSGTQGMSAYPNPAHDRLVVHTGELADAGEGRIRIAGETGKVLLDLPVEEPVQVVDLSGLKTGGVLFVVLTRADGAIVHAEKIVRQ